MFLFVLAGIVLTRINNNINMDALSVVHNYMLASSAHELHNIFNHMLDEKIDYTAGSGQRYIGKSEVELMMKPFFAKYGASLKWETVNMFTIPSTSSFPLPPAVVEQLSVPRSVTVEVVFRRHWEDAQAGAQVADGREWITVNDDNKITHIFVVLK